MKLIGFAGAARTGKDTACRLIGGYRLAFADALKNDLIGIVRDRYGWNPGALTSEQKEIVRPLYVAHGAVGRAVDPDMWIRPVVQCIEALQGRGFTPEPIADALCITDLRYRNEAEAVLKLGGIVIYLRRPGFLPINDEEEKSLSDMLIWAYSGKLGGRFKVVENDSDLPTLAARVREAASLESSDE